MIASNCFKQNTQDIDSKCFITIPLPSFFFFLTGNLISATKLSIIFLHGPQSKFSAYPTTQELIEILSMICNFLYTENTDNLQTFTREKNNLSNSFRKKVAISIS